MSVLIELPGPKYQLFSVVLPAPEALFPLNGLFGESDTSPNQRPPAHFIMATPSAGVNGEVNGSYSVDQDRYIILYKDGLNLDSWSIFFYLKVELFSDRSPILQVRHRSSGVVFGLLTSTCGDGFCVLFSGRGAAINTGVSFQLRQWIFIGFMANRMSRRIYFWKDDHIVHTENFYGGRYVFTDASVALGAKKANPYRFSFACVQIFDGTLDARQARAASSSCENLVPSAPGEE